MLLRGEKRFALLQATKDSDYAIKMYGGYLNVFIDAFGEEGEIWDLYRVVDDEFPDNHELHKYEGFVISGSPFDACGEESWIIKLCFLVQTLHLMQKKILGVCFGHQVICRALGGKVTRAYTGWDLGIREVNIIKDFFPCSLMDDLDEIPSVLPVIECHQDEVWELPVGAKVIGFSDKTNVEMFSMGDHVLGIQGHPEYSKDILDNIIDRLLNKGCIEMGFGEDARTKLFVHEPDRKRWEKICRKFLKSKRKEEIDEGEVFCS